MFVQAAERGEIEGFHGPTAGPEETHAKATQTQGQRQRGKNRSVSQLNGESTNQSIIMDYDTLLSRLNSLFWYPVHCTPIVSVISLTQGSMLGPILFVMHLFAIIVLLFLHAQYPPIYPGCLLLLLSVLQGALT